MAKTNNPPADDAQEKEHARRQREAARIHDENLKKSAAEEGAPSRTTAAHVGKPAATEHKEVEDISALGATNGPKKPAAKGKK
jgi:hypothetical protein